MCMNQSHIMHCIPVFGMYSIHHEDAVLCVGMGPCLRSPTAGPRSFNLIVRFVFQPHGSPFKSQQPTDPECRPLRQNTNLSYLLRYFNLSTRIIRIFAAIDRPNDTGSCFQISGELSDSDHPGYAEFTISSQCRASFFSRDGPCWLKTAQHAK